MLNNDGYVFKPRSIISLEKQIDACKDEALQYVLFAKKAGCLARHSRLAEAKSILKELRVANKNHDPRLSAWILFAEGQIYHFDLLDNVRAKEKFNRAFLAAQSAHERELVGTASAWLAHCEFVSGDIKSALDHVLVSFRASEPNSSDARGRSSMVLADALNWAGKTNLAKKWYKEARMHAVRDGDIAMQNVMLFNSAAHGVWRLTMLDCRQKILAEDWKFLTMEVDSAKSLNMALGIYSLSSMIPIMEAELLVIKHRWSEASEIFSSKIDKFIEEGQSRLLSKLLAQSAWCRANMGEYAEAKMDLSGSMLHIRECSDLDDLAVTYYRTASAHRLVGDLETSTRHEALAREYFGQFENRQAEVLDLLTSVLTAIEQK